MTIIYYKSSNIYYDLYILKIRKLQDKSIDNLQDKSINNTKSNKSSNYHKKAEL